MYTIECSGLSAHHSEGLWTSCLEREEGNINARFCARTWQERNAGWRKGELCWGGEDCLHGGDLLLKINPGTENILAIIIISILIFQTPPGNKYGSVVCCGMSTSFTLIWHFAATLHSFQHIKPAFEIRRDPTRSQIHIQIRSELLIQFGFWSEWSFSSEKSSTHWLCSVHRLLWAQAFQTPLLIPLDTFSSYHIPSYFILLSYLIISSLSCYHNSVQSEESVDNELCFYTYTDGQVEGEVFSHKYTSSSSLFLFNNKIQLLSRS